MLFMGYLKRKCSANATLQDSRLEASRCFWFTSRSDNHAGVYGLAKRTTQGCSGTSA